MKTFIFFLSFLIVLFSNAESISLPEVPAHIFVNKGKTNFDSIFQQTGIGEMVEEAFNQEILYHDYTREVHPNSDFQTYWSVFENRWSAVDIDKDGKEELIMQGKSTVLDEKEYVEIYKKSKEGWKRIYSEVGRLLAYKIHPNTNKIILYHHRYPCCNSSSHNIFTLRLIDDAIITKSKFFVGRDHGDMVGPFFPDTVNYDSPYKKLTSLKKLRWSPDVVEKNAFLNHSETNVIIHYNKGALYKELYRNKKWAFVIMYSGIVIEQAIVINPSNFIDKPVYGWIILDTDLVDS